MGSFSPVALKAFSGASDHFPLPLLELGPVAVNFFRTERFSLLRFAPFSSPLPKIDLWDASAIQKHVEDKRDATSSLFASHIKKKQQMMSSLLSVAAIVMHRLYDGLKCSDSI